MQSRLSAQRSVGHSPVSKHQPWLGRAAPGGALAVGCGPSASCRRWAGLGSGSGAVAAAGWNTAHRGTSASAKNPPPTQLAAAPEQLRPARCPRALLTCRRSLPPLHPSRAAPARPPPRASPNSSFANMGCSGSKSAAAGTMDTINPFAAHGDAHSRCGPRVWLPSFARRAAGRGPPAPRQLSKGAKARGQLPTRPGSAPGAGGIRPPPPPAPPPHPALTLR